MSARSVHLQVALQTLILKGHSGAPWHSLAGALQTGSPVSGRPAAAAVAAEHSPGRASAAVHTALPQLPAALLEGNAPNTRTLVPHPRSTPTLQSNKMFHTGFKFLHKREEPEISLSTTLPDPEPGFLGIYHLTSKMG